MLKLFLAILTFTAMWIGTSAAQSAYPEPDVVIAQDDWLIECYGPESRNGNCQLYHRVLMNGGTQIAVVFTVAYPSGSDVPYLQIALPLGADIAFGAKLSFGAEFDRNIPFTRCTDQGCLIEGAVTSNLLQSIRNASTGFVEIINDAGALQIPISLRGFSSALDRISPAAQAPVAQDITDIEIPVGPAVEIDPDFTPLTGN
jgi:invasion protein IalB